MSIKIKINSKNREDKEPSSISFKSEIRKTIDGNLMIFDHEDIDIIISPEKNKIIVYPKDIMDGKVYATQNRFMKFLMKKGIVNPESIHSGNIYSSLEAEILVSESDNVKSIDLLLLNVLKWIERERPYFDYLKKYEEEREEELLYPDEEDSTELGEVPHKDRKGTLRSSTGFLWEDKK